MTVSGALVLEIITLCDTKLQRINIFSTRENEGI